MTIKNIVNAEGRFVKRSYTFTNAAGIVVTRCFEKPETALKCFEKELRKMEEGHLDDAMGELLTEIANLRGEHADKRFYGDDPEIEYR